MLSAWALSALLLLQPTRAVASDDEGSEVDDADEMAFCTNTSKAALRACRHEARDDFWIAIGNCNNLSDPDAGEACARAAKVARRQAIRDCGAQFEARQEVCGALGEAPYDPQVDPSNFVDPLEIGNTVGPNPLFPLVPGTKWVYRNEVDGETITDTIDGETKEILGVMCLVVHDVVSDIDSGEVIEDTEDYYAQDLDGNVWYFGEIAQDFADGELVSIEGSWKAGVDSAKPGIQMEADPRVGDVYRQEFSLGNAEDLAEVRSTTGTESVPAASCDGNCLVTEDFTPIQPEAFENKFYAPGVGLILEVDPESGARVELIEKTTL